jgi:DNA-directed RNA polymerase II subunit RPB1
MGTIAAQSLGEPTTQLTLNSFHFSGISAKNITLGVPRFKEIINVLKNVKTPTMTLHMKDLSSLDRVSLDLECCHLNNVITSVEFVSKYEIEEELEEYEVDEKFPDYFDTLIKINIGRKQMVERKIELIHIIICLMKNGLYGIPSSDTIDNMYVYIFTPIGNNLNEMECIENTNNNIIGKMKIKGFDEIEKCYINNDIIETDGSCLKKVFSHDDIDYTKTISNIPTEVLDTLGVEAARQVIINEIKKVLEFDGGYINNSHFITLVDTMTYKGGIMSITRHGINKTEAGPLLKCSFEETIDILTDACIFSEVDYIKGVSEAITIGKLSNIGTGCIDLVMDPLDDDDEIDFCPDESSELWENVNYFSDDDDEWVDV